MKRNLFYLLMLVCSMSVFTACGDDDDVKFPIDEEIAGTYKGTLDVELDGETLLDGIANNISITNAGDNKINMGLKDFSLLGMNLNIDIQNCEVKESGDGYTFTGSQTLSLQAPIGDCPTVVNGVVSGQNITINLDITVREPLNQKVKVIYKGTRLTGSESSEAKILSFTFDSNIVTEQPVIDEATGSITFKVNDAATAEELQLVPTITISDKATISPASGVVQDFSGGKKVSYIVVAENGMTKTYVVSIDGKTVFYDFEDWTVDLSQATEDYQYPIIGQDYKNTDWASCNGAVMFIKAFGPMNGILYTGGWAMNSTTDCHSGSKALELESIDTEGGNIWGQNVPKVTAGTAFLGKFEAMNALEDPMTTTSFGIKYTQQPLEVKGFYKYTPGDKFYNAEGTLVANAKDACAISAVLYEVEDYEETLDGNTIYESNKIIASAMFTDDKKTEVYTPFKLDLTYTKDYDATKKYKFAIIFSASKDGAAYNAAVGSKLLIDDVTVIAK